MEIIFNMLLIQQAPYLKFKKINHFSGPRKFTTLKRKVIFSVSGYANEINI